MKRNVVRDAFELATPSFEQKERMRQEILSRLPEEKGRRTYRAKQEPQRRRWNWVPSVAAMLAVMVMAGFFLTKLLEGKEAVILPANTSAASAYEEILDSYEAAISDGWEPVRCEEAGISYLAGRMESKDAMGYLLRDMDGNGTQELLMICNDESQAILDMYTLENGEAVSVFSGWERNAYFLREDNRILNIGSGGAARTDYVFYRLRGKTLEQEESIYFDAERDMENPWFMGEDMHPVTQQEAEAAISAHTIERTEIVLLSQRG